jgi:ubiquinone/menaquinone biosynthesis C-methylase UbiE
MTKDTERKDHWESVYQQKPADETSWHQAVPRWSLSMIAAANPGCDTPIIDIGGGASLLVDHLLEQGFNDVTVLDISAAALEQTKARLGSRAGRPCWVEADVTQFSPARRYGLWHDRAAFHFLTAPDDRRKYVGVLNRSLEPQGQAIIATFSPLGPEKCSGLEIIQYTAGKMQAVLGPSFELLEQQEELHLTPWGDKQNFNFFRFRKMK